MTVPLPAVVAAVTAAWIVQYCPDPLGGLTINSDVPNCPALLVRDTDMVFL